MIKNFVLSLLTFSVLSVPFAPASENLFQFQAPDIDGEKLSLRRSSRSGCQYCVKMWIHLSV